MSVVAWDGETLAADKQAATQSHRFTVRKIERCGGCLIGVVGCASKIGEFVAWARGGYDPSKYPKNGSSDDEYFVAIVVTAEAIILRYETSPVPFVVEDAHHAIGTGRDFARAAMHLGKSAREAVEIACLFSTDGVFRTAGELRRNSGRDPRLENDRGRHRKRRPHDRRGEPAERHDYATVGRSDHGQRHRDAYRV